MYGIGVLLLSCSNDKQPKAGNEDGAVIQAAATVKINESANMAKSALSLETISELPADIKNGMAVYAPDMVALNNKEYILAANKKGKAYMKVSGRMIALKLDKKIDEGSITKEIYKGSGYMVHLISHKVKRISDDAWLYTGELLILDNDHHESTPIVGMVNTISPLTHAPNP